MREMISRNDWSLVRFIIPAFPREENIFTYKAKKTTALGPIMVATVANKLWGWRVELIDENRKYRGPKDSNGLPDHVVLQKENPAAVVGFYCGLSSTMERVWELAEFYRKEGTFNIAGGWHAHYCPEETLNHNIDVVVHGDGEQVIQQILKAFKRGSSLEQIPGISFMKNGQMVTNLPKALETQDLNNLPYPDFGLLSSTNKIKIFPISYIRGCNKRCEYCTVRGKVRSASAEHLFSTVNWLVQTRKAKRFFIVDDRIEAEKHLKETINFFNMISKKYGNRLHFIVQMRLEAADNTELLEIMKKAGVRTVCIGCESPIDADLKAMGKGYLSSEMLQWTKVFKRYFRWVHEMFMVGYPLKEKQQAISPKEIVRCFTRFIRKSAPDSVQILLPGPIVGSELRKRLEKQGRIFSLNVVSWRYYDGSYPCFKPDNMSVRQFQEIGLKLMSRFYNPWSFLRVPLRIFTFLFDVCIRGWEDWHRGWKKDIIQCGGHLLIQRWRRKQRIDDFIDKLEKY